VVVVVDDFRFVGTVALHSLTLAVVVVVVVVDFWFVGTVALLLVLFRLLILSDGFALLPVDYAAHHVAVFETRSVAYVLPLLLFVLPFVVGFLFYVVDLLKMEWV